MFSLVRTTLNSKYVTSQERAPEDKSNFMAQSLQWNFFLLLEQGAPCLNSAPGPTLVGGLSLSAKFTEVPERTLGWQTGQRQSFQALQLIL